MATIQEINQSIMFGNLSNDQLDSIIHAVKFRRNELLKQNKRSLTIGSEVKFVSSRTGQTIIGKVFNAGFTNWRVPANMLEVV